MPPLFSIAQPSPDLSVDESALSSKAFNKTRRPICWNVATPAQAAMHDKLGASAWVRAQLDLEIEKRSKNISKSSDQ